jgi:hypothetical protein
MAFSLGLYATVATASSPPEGPLLRILTPSTAMRVNSATLRVQAVVAAWQPDRRRRFVFEGETVDGRNAGRIDSIEIAIDGRVVARKDVIACRRQFVLDEIVALEGLLDGGHELRVTAMEKGHRASRTTEVTTFEIDRALPWLEPNRIEVAAMPAPFACVGGRDHDDNEDDDGPPPAYPHVHGRFVLGSQSDGIDLARDRVIIAANGAQVVLEPGTFQCNRGGECRYENRFDPFLSRIVLEQRGTLWRFRLTGGPQWPRDPVLHVRVGNDGGGIDLRTGERLVNLRPVVDDARRVEATIGSAGGTLQTVDAIGVAIRLDVPAGALTRDTVVSLTPLATSPLAAPSGALHPGVELGPNGTTFAIPATLTLDFSAEGTSVADGFFFLLTSPLTTVPVPATADAAGAVLTALIEHFSAYQPGGSGSFADMVQWANAALSGGPTLTLSELKSLLELAELQQQVGCQGQCLNLGLLAERAEESLDALASLTCDADEINPTNAALQRWVNLETLGQQLGADTTAVRACTERVLRSAIQQAAGLASVNQSDAMLARLRDLAQTADQLGFSIPASQALQALAAALRELMTAAAGLCSNDAPSGQAELERALLWAEFVGGVDAGLAHDLQSAMAGCAGGTGPVAVLSVMGRGVSFNGSAVSGVQTRPSAPCGEEGPCDFVEDTLGADTPAPFTLSSPGLTAKVWQPSPNVIAVDATVVALPAANGWREATISLLLDFEFSGPGILTVQVNPLWQISPPDQVCSGVFPTDAKTGASAAYGVWAVCDVNANLAGNGRLVTFTFTPTP